MLYVCVVVVAGHARGHAKGAGRAHWVQWPLAQQALAQCVMCCTFWFKFAHPCLAPTLQGHCGRGVWRICAVGADTLATGGADSSIKVWHLPAWLPADAWEHLRQRRQGGPNHLGREEAGAMVLAAPDLREGGGAAEVAATVSAGEDGRDGAERGRWRPAGAGVWLLSLRYTAYLPTYVLRSPPLHCGALSGGLSRCQLKVES